MSDTVHAASAEHSHPGPWKYIQIAAILALITAAEVALYYIKAIPNPLLVVLLLFFSTIKFIMVVMYFMHLKFDALIYRRLFMVGLTLALAVYVVVLLTFGILR